MNFKIFIRTLFFLLILLLVLYTVSVNTQVITFNFPVLLKEPLKEGAWLIFFAMFALGVFGGTLLHLGGGKGGDGGKRK